MQLIAKNSVMFFGVELQGNFYNFHFAKSLHVLARTRSNLLLGKAKAIRVTGRAGP
jgi:hypothetical protein